MMNTNPTTIQLYDHNCIFTFKFAKSCNSTPYNSHGLVHIISVHNDKIDRSKFKGFAVLAQMATFVQ